MRFIGENHMILNAATVKRALEIWLNEQRVNALEITAWVKSGDGIKIRFRPQQKIATLKPTEPASSQGKGANEVKP